MLILIGGDSKFRVNAGALTRGLIADILLTDKDDMVQKGYGWMLKEASKPYRKAVFDYVVKHKTVMPRTALRYAIELMPPEMRAEAMSKIR